LDPTEATEKVSVEYTRRRELLSQRRSRLQTQERRTGYTQLALAVLVVAWLIFRVRHFQAVDLLLLIPATLFVVLAVVHGRLIRSIKLCSRRMKFYEQGLDRLNGNWAGRGYGGEHFLEPSHPCARDLDLFGRGSVFELLCTARTHAGEETLAKWLLAPAPPDEVRARQEATAELSQLLDFRESLSILGEDLALGIRPGELAAWGEAQTELPSGKVRVLTAVLAAAWVLCAVAWKFWNAPDLLLMAATVINLGVSYRFRRSLDAAVHAAEEAGQDLKLLSQLLTAFELQSFRSPKLVELQNHLRLSGVTSSRAIARLGRRVEFLESAHNLFVRILDFVIFYRLQFVLAVESWRRRHGPLLRTWIQTIGELEALAALGGYAYEHPGDVFPEFTSELPCFAAEGLAHPFIPRGRAVENNIRLDRDLQLIIVSGPNMAGKSTFLRGIGVNAVLAQCGAPVRAASLKLSPLAIAASICVLDSLEGGISRFYAEINRLKQIMDLTTAPTPVLFLLDELLSGTNSHDRFLGTRSFVTRLVEQGAVGLVSTHDLALTAIPEAIGSRAVNSHFEDHLEAGKLAFDYKLYPGVVKTSNALALMRSIGLDV
jgi:MutS domain V